MPVETESAPSSANQAGKTSKKTDKKWHPTVVKPFNLSVSRRLEERTKVTGDRHSRDTDREKREQELKTQKEREEKKAIREHRKTLDFKANPIRHYKPGGAEVVKKQPTVAHSPRLTSGTRVRDAKPKEDTDGKPEPRYGQRSKSAHARPVASTTRTTSSAKPTSVRTTTAKPVSKPAPRSTSASRVASSTAKERSSAPKTKSTTKSTTKPTTSKSTASKQGTKKAVKKKEPSPPVEPVPSQEVSLLDISTSGTEEQPQETSGDGNLLDISGDGAEIEQEVVVPLVPMEDFSQTENLLDVGNDAEDFKPQADVMVSQDDGEFIGTPVDVPMEPSVMDEPHHTPENTVQDTEPHYPSERGLIDTEAQYKEDESYEQDVETSLVSSHTDPVAQGGQEQVDESEEPSPFTTQEETSPFTTQEEPVPFTGQEEPAAFSTTEEPSPFTNTEEEPSPFTNTEEEPSPFTTTEKEPSPFTYTEEEPSPFTNTEKEPSPFTNTEEEPSPFTTQEKEPSPFTTQEKEPSPFTTQEEEPSPSTNTEEEPSPFTNTEEEPSPFTNTEKEPSPFTNTEKEPSPFTNTEEEPSPFTNTEKEPSPFTNTDEEPSPFTNTGEEPSPFTNTGEEPSPFTTETNAEQDHESEDLTASSSINPFTESDPFAYQQPPSNPFSDVPDNHFESQMDSTGREADVVPVDQPFDSTDPETDRDTDIPPSEPMLDSEAGSHFSTVTPPVNPFEEQKEYSSDLKTEPQELLGEDGNDDVGKHDIEVEGDMGESDVEEGDLGDGYVGDGDVGEGDMGDGNVGNSYMGEGDVGESKLDEDDFQEQELQQLEDQPSNDPTEDPILGQGPQEEEEERGDSAPLEPDTSTRYSPYTDPPPAAEEVVVDSEDDEVRVVEETGQDETLQPHQPTSPQHHFAIQVGYRTIPISPDFGNDDGSMDN